MSFLDFNGLSRFHDKVKIMLSKKQDKLTKGDNIKLDNNGNIGIIYDVPVGGGTIKLTLMSGASPQTGKIGISRIYDKIEASGSLNGCFSNDTDLEVFDIAGSDLTAVNNSGYMFYNCANLREIDFTDSPIQKATGMAYMFYNCKNLSNSSIQTFLFKPLVSTVPQYMFYGCEGLEEIPAEWSFQNATNATAMFRNCKNLTTFSPESLNSTTLKQCYYMFMDCGLTSMPDITIPNATTCASMFRNNGELQSIGTITTGTALTSVANMFQGCKKLQHLDVFNTSKVTSFDSFLNNCEILDEVPLFDTSSATMCQGMCISCRAITEIPDFDLRNVTTANQIFENCNSLTYVPDLDLPKVTNLGRAFYNDYSLETAPSISCPKAQSLNYMFYMCKKLKDIPFVDCSSAIDMSAAFTGCYLLETVNLKDIGKAYVSSGAAQGKSQYHVNFYDTKLSIEMFRDFLQNQAYDLTLNGFTEANRQQITPPYLLKNDITAADDALANSKGWYLTKW